MATKADHTNLKNYHYVRLGQAISSVAMESIALGYLDIDEEIIENIKENRKGNAEAVTRDLIRRWANSNPRNQIKVSEFVRKIVTTFSFQYRKHI